MTGIVCVWYSDPNAVGFCVVITITVAIVHWCVLCVPFLTNGNCSLALCRGEKLLWFLFLMIRVHVYDMGWGNPNIVIFGVGA